MPDALLLLPDFLLIALGYVLCRHTPMNRSVWDGAERLVYYVLFPTLLFQAVLRNPLQVHTALPLVGCGLALCAAGIGLSMSLRALPGVDGRLHASGAQTAFRFNSYVALAVAERLAGVQGLAWMAVLISVSVPVCNVAAVWPLARSSGQGVGRELVRNPLIVSTVAGLAANLAGVVLPEVVTITLTRMGSAGLPLGLMAVGAGLHMGALREAPRLAAGFLTIRHAVLPLVSMVLVQAWNLPPTQQLIVVAFAAMPTASSAYVLAARLGGNGSYVAGLVTVSTLVAMPAVPVTLALWSAVQP